MYVRSIFTCVCSLQTSAEMFSEVVLSNTLNKLRGGPFGDSDNMCTTFVETKAYDTCCLSLIPFHFVLIFFLKSHSFFTPGDWSAPKIGGTMVLGSVHCS